MNNRLVKYSIIFILLAIFQIAIAKNLILFDTAFAFPYILILLILPISISDTSALMIGFAMGLIMDMFYNTGGIHTSACVLMMYSRGKWLNLNTPQGGFDAGSAPDLSIAGVPWFITYSIVLIFLHHAALFVIESFGAFSFWMTTKKIFLSTLLTFFLCLILLILFERGKRK